IYGLIIFPRALGYIDEAVTDLFDQLDTRVTPVPVILAETFRSLSACRSVGEGRFIGCAQLLLVWFHNHFWKVDKVSYRVFSKNYSPLKKLADMPRRDNITVERWIVILQNLKDEDVEWKAPWMVPDEILYRCGDFNWVPLLGIWGVVGYASLIVLKQYGSRQFVPATQRLAQCEFSYKDDGYKKKIREMTNAWKQTHRMKRFTIGAMTTPEYHEHLQVVPSELEQLEEEKMRLGLDVDIHKLEAEKFGKNIEQWRKEIKEENTKVDQWEKKFQDARARESALEKSLLECRDEKARLKARIAELERSLHLCHSRNSMIELRASLSKIEELKEKIRELEDALQNSELRVELLERRNEQYQEQLRHFQSQIRDRDYVMGEAVTQVREVVDYLQTLAVQADILSLKYESEPGRGRELAWLLKRVKALSIKAKPYM
ncbi:hypothetical protein Gotri_006920, partial [Gossypium trilobum]|nr:hypothetical protein [Gossypium trilobum]